MKSTLEIRMTFLALLMTFAVAAVEEPLAASRDTANM